jgi:hypothetical protein
MSASRRAGLSMAEWPERDALSGTRRPGARGFDAPRTCLSPCHWVYSFMVLGMSSSSFPDRRLGMPSLIHEHELLLYFLSILCATLGARLAWIDGGYKNLRVRSWDCIHRVQCYILIQIHKYGSSSPLICISCKPLTMVYPIIR